jgi:hypothetical protein
MIALERDAVIAEALEHHLGNSIRIRFARHQSLVAVVDAGAKMSAVVT